MYGEWQAQVFLAQAKMGGLMSAGFVQTWYFIVYTGTNLQRERGAYFIGGGGVLAKGPVDTKPYVLLKAALFSREPPSGGARRLPCDVRWGGGGRCTVVAS